MTNQAPTKGPVWPEIQKSAAHISRSLGLVWSASRRLTIAIGILTLIAPALNVGMAYAGKRIVDAVVAHNRTLTLWWVAAEFLLVVGFATTTRLLSLVRSVLGSRLGIDINLAILNRALHLDLSHFEDSEFYDSLTKARREASSRPLQLVTETFALVQSALTLLGYIGILVRFNGIVVLVLMVATIPATLAEISFSKTLFRTRNWRSPDARRLTYLEYVLANDEHAKEVKLFGVGPLLLGRYKDLAERFHREDSVLAVRKATATHALSLIATLAFYGSYGLMAGLAALGRLSLGNLTMYVVAFRNGQQSFQSILSGLGGIYEHNLYMTNLFAFLDQSDKALGAHVPTKSVQDSRDHSMSPIASRGLVLENVSFRYPGQDKWTLSRINLSIPHGTSIAFVGQNGAGKTTLIKLITRLYTPTEGRILLDGKDLQEWNESELRNRFGVVFQDFNQYQLSLRENVGIGSVDHLNDLGRVERALHRGGAELLVGELAQGIETPLGRWFAKGAELSGGQWQKVALSRAFMRDEADILILDEPTAALDAEAEHAVFMRFRELASDKTAIVISHRFPTVRMADLIVVLNDGEIVEQGTHAELVAARGIYAKLYGLQREGYQD